MAKMHISLHAKENAGPIGCEEGGQGSQFSGPGCKEGRAGWEPSVLCHLLPPAHLYLHSFPYLPLTSVSDLHPTLYPTYFSLAELSLPVPRWPLSKWRVGGRTLAKAPRLHPSPWEQS